MKEINVLTEMQLKAEMRALYKQIGMKGMMQVLYEVVKSAEWISEIMLEERTKEQQK